jgi:hypothetical protein
MWPPLQSRALKMRDDPILKTTSKTPRSSKTPLPASAQKEPAIEIAPMEKARIKTVLVASYGWPTADMQPSRRQHARR